MSESVDPLEWVPNVPCYATHWVGTDGQPVGFMYRGIDDGWWVFMSGRETQAEMDDPTTTAIYSLRTIAALDPSIAPYLDVEPGRALERTSSDAFVETEVPA